MHGTTGVDAAQPLGHHLDLGLADGAVERMQLTVGVADADIVQIEQRDFAHPGAGNRFRRPGADAAHTHDGHVRITQALHALQTIQAGNTGETGIFCTHGAAPQKTGAQYTSQPDAGTVMGCAALFAVTDRSYGRGKPLI